MQKYWRKDNDLYTADIAPVDGAIEITEEEYNSVFESRTVVHYPEVEDSEGGEHYNES